MLQAFMILRQRTGRDSNTYIQTFHYLYINSKKQGF